MNYIMESTPKTVNIDPQIIEILEQKVLSKEPLTEEEINIFLDYICYETRCKFTNDINNFSFQFKCDKAQAIITHYLNSLKQYFYKDLQLYLLLDILLEFYELGLTLQKQYT